MDEEAVSATCVTTRQSALYCGTRLGSFLLARVRTAHTVSHGICCTTTTNPQQIGKTTRNRKHLCQAWLPYTGPDSAKTCNKSPTVRNHSTSPILPSIGSSDRWRLAWPAAASESIDNWSTEQCAVEVARGFWLDVILPCEEGEGFETKDRGYTHYT